MVWPPLVTLSFGQASSVTGMWVSDYWLKGSVQLSIRCSFDDFQWKGEVLCLFGQPLMLEVDEFITKFFGGYNEKLARGLKKIYKKHCLLLVIIITYI